MNHRRDSFKNVVIILLSIILLLLTYRHTTEQPISNNASKGDMEMVSYRLKTLNSRSLELKASLKELRQYLLHISDRGGTSDNADTGKSAGTGAVTAPLLASKDLADHPKSSVVRQEDGVRAVNPDVKSVVHAGPLDSQGGAAGIKSIVVDGIVGLEHVPSLDALNPAKKVSHDRTGVSMVIGIPTVQRSKENYLVPTIKSLLQNLALYDKNDLLFVVMVADTDMQKVETVFQEVTSAFPEEVKSGLIDVIAPSHKLYPDFDAMKPSFDDPMPRFKWRTKQVFDFAYLMMYARSRGMFYLQLEDDIQARPNFASLIVERAKKDSNWVLLEFSYLGFIGKLFRSRMLTEFIHLLLANAQFKPVDWLLDDWFYLRYCHPEKDYKDCRARKKQRRILYQPSLFQHIGHYSSLDGKIQKLQDRSFKQSIQQPTHVNPAAIVSGTVEHFQQFTLESAYLQSNYFWGKAQHDGDRLQFTFNAPTKLKRLVIPSGSTDHPGDVFRVTSKLQYLTYEDNNKEPQKDNWKELCSLNSQNSFDCLVDSKVPDLKAISIIFKENSSQWILIPGIYLHTK